MTDIVALDFESFYDRKEFSLSKMSTEAYVRDPRFEVIMVAAMVNGGSPQWFSGTRRETRRWLLGLADWNKCLLLSHNTSFDGAIMNWHLGIKPKGYLDTMSMAQALHGINESVSLKSLAERYFLPAKGTEINNADGKRRADFTPEELEAYAEYCMQDTWLCQTLFDIMVPKFPREELKLIDMTIRMFCEPMLELDQPLLEQHLLDVRDEQQNSLNRLTAALGAQSAEETKTILMSNPKFADLLKYLGVDPPVKISPTTGKEAYAFAKTDEGFTQLLEHENLTVQAAVAARLGNKTTIEESRTEAFIGVASRGAFPFPLKYAGAAVTLRWAGTDKINVQNMGRGSVLRQSIKAPKGFKIVAADLSNIELRLGLWLAGQDDKLDLIRNGLDLYMDIAAPVFNKTYEEVEVLGKKSTERTTGKIIQLSGIFGTGAAKMQSTLRIIGKVKLDLPKVQGAVNIYRSDYNCVVSAWDKGKEVLDAIYHKQDYGTYLKVLDVTAEGLVKPNGMVLAYPDLRWTRDSDGKMGYTYEQKRKARDRVYGSKVFQRCTQALARDIIAEHILKIDKRYQVVGTVHDEIICLVADDEVKEAQRFMLEVMRTPPVWALDKDGAGGLPLDAEIGVGDNYGDAK